MAKPHTDETLEALAVENRHAFLNAGGENHAYIPALNDRADHAVALADLSRRHSL